ncbi:SGNH/GDSL hydrolase family protein [Clostridium thermarum]|uniref:SGNH/GDSL hydrolase family protein n=1 Tax=Clostridium thermarum TaxID=1716543 RepID=UPI0013D8B82C|nr:SGNH/GDSL hydrolase family protein [Clostridium thermarum]
MRVKARNTAFFLLLVFMMVNLFTGFSVQAAETTTGLSPEEIYMKAYVAVKAARENQNQKSIDAAREAVDKLETTIYKDYAKDLEDEIQLLQKGLMQKAIAIYNKNAENFNEEEVNELKALLDDMRTSSSKEFVAWANSLKSQTNLLLYQKAVKEIGKITYSLPNVQNSIRDKKKLKVAFWGDSITEGSDIEKAESYAELLIKEIQNSLPEVTVEHKNFSLGGRNAFLASSSQYKATNPETNATVNFWRSWATVGKTWKDHVVEYKPDLLILAFGMNDVTNNLSSYNFIRNIDNIIDYVEANSPNTDVVLVSTITPTVDKTLYKQNNEYTMQIARATREYAKLNNIPLIDANRLWTILLKGVDEKTYTEKEVYGISQIAATNFYNGELQVSLKEYGDLENSTDILLRGSEADGGLLFKFYQKKDKNIITLYSIDNVQQQQHVEFVSVDARDINTIKLDGATITINDEKFILYKHLRNGFVSFKQNLDNIADISLKYEKPVQMSQVYQEAYMLGYTNWYSSGNGINHPTALATQLVYVSAYKPIVKAAELQEENSK